MINVASSFRILTPRQFAIQWAVAPNIFEVNILNFKVRAAKIAENMFKQSFYLQRFNDKSTFGWHVKHPKDHPILVETGNLKNSIKYQSTKTGMKVYTDPNGFATSKRQYGRNFCYAGIHNEGVGNIPKNQFMGNSSLVEEKINDIVYQLFMGVVV